LKKIKAEGFSLTYFKISIKPQESRQYGTTKGIYTQISRTELRTRKKFLHLLSVDFDKCAKITQWRKDVFSTNIAETI
jgi:hypothetical protein